MKRAYSVILGILLGAVAAGVGVGIFLKLANDDRTRLAEELDVTVQNAKLSREENQRLVEEANRKLTQANVEISKAQQLVASLEEERKQIAIATPLAAPASRAIRDWKSAVDLDLGVSIKYPADSAIEQNAATELTIARTVGTESARWFSLTPYDTRLESEMLMAFTTSTPVSYVIQGHLVTGRKGTILDQRGTIYVLQIHSNGTTTHLLWIKDAVTPGATMNVLSSMTFAS